VLAAWHGGAALAGCSAGAMALTSGAPPDLTPGGGRRDDRDLTPAAGAGGGLDVVGHLAVIPHFDLLERRRPDIVEWFAAWQPPGTTLVGVEEETALVGTGPRWRVHGGGAVWVLGPGPRERFAAGDDVPVDRPGTGARP
jgi:cyanophycinase